MLTPRRSILVAALVLAAMSHAMSRVSTEAFAQTYPSKPVRVLVPFAPGAVADLLARLLAEQLQVRWQQPVVVENKAGASGNIGTTVVARAPADGYTLLVSPPPPLAINQFLFKALSFKPSDLTIVSIIATTPNVLVGKKQLPAANLAELIALAKATPGKLNYASTGRGGTPHLTMEWLKSKTGMDLVHVPYASGPGAALNDLLGGHVDVMFVNLSDAKPLVKAGQLKALAVSGDSQTDDLPGVSAISRDIPGFMSVTWFAIAAPSGTPAAVVQKISVDIAQILKSPAVVERLRTFAVSGKGSSPEAAAEFVGADSRRWQSVIGSIGLQPE
jgi:tripartite-type tricarboxylate transporter receptor subunit TctC